MFGFQLLRPNVPTQQYLGMGGCLGSPRPPQLGPVVLDTAIGQRLESVGGGWIPLLAPVPTSEAGGARSPPRALVPTPEGWVRGVVVVVRKGET